MYFSHFCHHFAGAKPIDYQWRMCRMKVWHAIIITLFNTITGRNDDARAADAATDDGPKHKPPVLKAVNSWSM